MESAYSGCGGIQKPWREHQRSVANRSSKVIPSLRSIVSRQPPAALDHIPSWRNRPSRSSHSLDSNQVAKTDIAKTGALFKREGLCDFLSLAGKSLGLAAVQDRKG